MEKNTIIHAHIIAWNEENILPYTLDYYSKFCEKIFIYDNYSTDNSDEIYKKYNKVTVIKWSNDDKYNDVHLIKIKNECYKNESRTADWVIVCDCDEFLYHSNLIEKLNEYKLKGITIPLISGHDMVSSEFPIYDGELLTNKVKVGSDMYMPMCKNIIFDPKINIYFTLGAHSSTSDNTIYSENRELKLLHYKFLGVNYVEKLYKNRVDRLSDFNKQHGLSVHWNNVPYEYMKTILEKNNNVI